jgi:hypothetical protein
MQFYVARIWSAGQPQHFSDLYAPWWGAHVLFVEGRNPYALAVANEIQIIIYGAPIESGHRGDSSSIAGGFAYPLYAALLLWPTVHMSFSAVQMTFFFVSLFAVLASLMMWLRALQFRGRLTELLMLALFTVGSFPALEGIRLQNLSVIAAAFLALSVILLTSEHLAIAGIFLAISTFKPQFTVVLVPWLVLWTACEWRRRQSLAWSFLASMLLLLGMSEWLLRGWMRDFFSVVRAYRQYTFGRSLLDVWFTPCGGPFAAAILLLAVSALCWQYLRHPANSPGFFLAVSVVLATTLTVIPTLAPHTQLLLLPGWLCLYRHRVLVSLSSKFVRIAVVAAWILLGWQWVATMGLAIVLAVRPAATLLSWRLIPLYTSRLLPLAVVIALSCLIRIHAWRKDDWADPFSQ